MKRTLLASLALATLLAGQFAAAQAGEITLYARDNFRGEEVTIRDGSRNLRDSGFNDRASSMVVHSGVWEICADKDFGGYCAVFERGEYPSLPRFNNSISSARQVERGRGQGHGQGQGQFRDRDRDGVDDRVEREQRREEWRDGRRDERDGYGGAHPEPIELFEHARFEGRRVAFQGEARSMRGVDFNDRASSLVIYQGQWQLCEHDNFGGQCNVYGPGRYDNLGNMNDRVSSLRRVR
ncbi:beta/gamma crystallin-related protein [Pseudoduganella namucuonensis]|uniref:Beta/Gamma crystallin n=1 Tax=Pseudoduganella namucuonensis TaxID=1035707 RepID=A0A1I7I6I8_9BURK|nr:beta/gamma crystallin-related protein [Pseudoduganella namucuonensis]SFU68376.1 Beta/Gamma crystallin [Pseudoduganella namucuonensis]